MANLADILSKLQAQRSLTARQVQAISRSFARYQGAISDDLLAKVTDQIKAGLQDILFTKEEAGVEIGKTVADVRAQLQSLFDRFGPAEIADTINLDFHVRTGADVAAGAGNFVQSNLAGVVDEYPAQELIRFEDRLKPRRWSGDEGTEDKSLMAGFASRWMEAAQIANDSAAARMLEEEGRMIALKSSGIWQALGDFDDGLGNPYPPFAFNSGMWTQDVSRAECEELGLLEPGQAVTGAAFDFDNLFDFATAA